jgi:hypothetical protein
MLAVFHWSQLLHPLAGNGYQFWSGIGSDAGEAALLGGVVVLLRHRNCHVKGCWRLGHLDPEHGHPACRRHHSKADRLEGAS